MTIHPATRGRFGPRPRRAALAMVLALALLPCQPPARALSCIAPGPLLPPDPRQTLVLGDILSRQEDGSVVIQVVEVLQGAAPPPAMARGSAHPPGTLRLDSRQLSYWTFGRLPFPRGSRWIFQLFPVDRQAGDFDAALSPCIEPPQVIQGVVRGWLLNSPGRDRPQAMTLRELRQRIRAASRSFR